MPSIDTAPLEVFGDWIEISAASTGLLDSLDGLDLDHLDADACWQLEVDMAQLILALHRRHHAFVARRREAETEYLQR